MQQIQEMKSSRKSKKVKKKQLRIPTADSQKCMTILKGLPDIVYIIDPEGNFTFINNSIQSLGFKPKDLIGQHFSALVHPEDVKSFSRSFVLPKYSGKVTGDDNAPKLIDERRTGTRKTKDLEIRLTSKKAKKGQKNKSEIIGKVIAFGDVSSTGHYEIGKDEKQKRFLGSIGIIRDITERRQIEDALKKSEKRYKDLVERADVAILIDDSEGKLKYYNSKLAQLFGYSIEELRNQSIESLIHVDDVNMVMAYHRDRMQGKKVPSTYEFKGRHRDGSILYLEVHVVELKENNKIIGTRSYLWNVTERKRVENELRTQLLDDELTGLHNRRGFSILTQQQLKIAERKEMGFWILFADLDKLKWINDNFGHIQGDLALKATAHILRKCFRKSDIIARIGGDEFAVLTIETPEKSGNILIKRLRETLNQYNAKSKQQYKLSLSIGAVFYDPQRPLSIDELLASADSLMYRQKRRKLKP